MLTSKKSYKYCPIFVIVDFEEIMQVLLYLPSTLSLERSSHILLCFYSILRRSVAHISLLSLFFEKNFSVLSLFLRLTFVLAVGKKFFEVTTHSVIEDFEQGKAKITVITVTSTDNLFLSL